MKTQWILLFLLALAVVALTGCPPVTPAPGTTHTLSGKVKDTVTGAPLADMAVAFESYSATTGSDGTFTMDLGTAGGLVSGPFTLRGSGYVAYYVNPVTLDAGQDTQVAFSASADFAYPTHSVTIQIQDQSSTEIADGTKVDLYVLNGAGGYYGVGGLSYTTGGYQVSTPTFGTDCLVAATVNLATPFNALATHVDLSASSTPVTLTQDAGVTSVSVTGDLAGNVGQLALVSTYGAFGAGTTVLAGTPAVATLNVSNPDGYTCQWTQAKMDNNYLGSGNMMTWMSIAGPIAHTPSVLLPALDTSVGITEIPNPTLITYSGGVLAIPALAGTNYHQFYLYDVVAGRPVAAVITTAPSVSLPTWLQTRLAGRSVYVLLTPVGVDVSLDMSVVAAITSAHNGPPAIPMHVGVLNGTFAKTLDF